LAGGAVLSLGPHAAVDRAGGGVCGLWAGLGPWGALPPGGPLGAGPAGSGRPAVRVRPPLAAGGRDAAGVGGAAGRLVGRGHRPEPVALAAGGRLGVEPLAVCRAGAAGAAPRLPEQLRRDGVVGGLLLGAGVPVDVPLFRAGGVLVGLLGWLARLHPGG